MNAPAFWTARSPGERALLAGLGGLAVALLAVAFVWLPLERSRTRIAAELPQLRASVTEMRAQAEEVRVLRAMPARGATGGTSLANLLASGTLSQGIPGARLSAVDARRVRVAVDDASWTRLVEWLSALHAAHGLSVDEATIEALAAAGRVRANLVLVAP